MLYRFAADALVALHFGFILFVVLGGFLAWRWPRLAWVHLPAAVWGALIEFLGWVCPLTPLENTWRASAGQAGYEGSFVEHYIVPVIYPVGLTTNIKLLLGTLVLLVNVLAYTMYIRRHRSSRPSSSHDTATGR
jgi:hypothetical protein